MAWRTEIWHNNNFLLPSQCRSMEGSKRQTETERVSAVVDITFNFILFIWFIIFVFCRPPTNIFCYPSLRQRTYFLTHLNYYYYVWNDLIFVWKKKCLDIFRQWSGSHYVYSLCCNGGTTLFPWQRRLCVFGRVSTCRSGVRVRWRRC